MPCLNPCFNGRWSLTSDMNAYLGNAFSVLILVLMEDGLWLFVTKKGAKAFDSLNPCFNGRWSLTLMKMLLMIVTIISLNPCFNGRWSLTMKANLFASCVQVLILVLMEDGLWQRGTKGESENYFGLNPCFNGRWSLTFVKMIVTILEK